MANFVISIVLLVLFVLLLIKFGKGLNRAVDAAQVQLIRSSAESHGRALRDMRKSLYKSKNGKITKKQINSLSVDELADQLTLSIGEDY